ncbi:penicillin-binding protein [Actinoallomurus sp. NBC_01490]|uniref:transglycosylase domain-containing protein n=1 Tax=Actinoallomurus sp. NBC_01490 TaxID=2903557 RepID=UPI002E33B76E|nr:transglycosylase domain-containing protein [Actinoallomurus sp. NBC_01490]
MPSWKLVLATMGIGTLASICMVGVAYAMVKVPTVNQTSTDQGATVYWNDGSQMMKIGSSRTVVQLNQISKPMQQAVVSVEDRNFYHESAVSPTGITRALINDLKGGSTQGGSTITQQYVKNAYLNQEQTISRKFKEIFISVKVGKQQDKDQILQNYLNTIFFGRGANGVEAAAQAYFGKHASALTVPEAAILAAQAKQPGYYDPAIKSHLQDTVNRYDIVLQAMVRSGAISQTDYLKYKDHLPKVKPRSKGNALGGQKGFLYERVKNALSGMGYSDQQIENGGLKVYTTWDKTLQAKAQQTVENDLKARHMPKDTRVGLVTMDPTKGEILAAYGGADFVKRQVDDAYYSTAQVGSSFKPYVLATALKKGISLKTIMNGKSPQYFTTDGDSVAAGTPGATRFINDEANAPNPYVNLVQATADSLNTVYVPLGYKAGWQDVYNLAKSAGLPKQGLQDGHPGEGGFFLGQSDIAPVYQASGYSTIANDGNYITPHSIRRVVDPTTGKTKQPTIERHSAFSAEVAHDVQYAMQSVVTRGTGKNAAVPGREVAGKTGTTNDNVAAWFSGFTPKQLVTTIGMWRFQDRTKKHAAKTIPLQNVGGYPAINGGDLPATIWHDYMSKALSLSKYNEVTHFPPPAYVGNTDLSQTPPPTTKPTPENTPTPTCLPYQNPTRDNCKPSDGGNQNPNCTLHPNRPNCPETSPPASPTCKRIVGCESPPDGNNNGGQGPNARAARPIDE